MIEKNDKNNMHDKNNIYEESRLCGESIKANEARVKPFLLKPAGKDYLWGGNRLNNEYGKKIKMQPLAESWECSTHPDGPSIVASGDMKGRQLTDVLGAYPEYLGTHPMYLNAQSGRKCELPVLIKLIDAKEDLSVQVHPDDDYARRYENGQLGKTEMWYVLDAAEDAKLIYGLYRNTDKETLRKSIMDGTIDKHLQKVRVKKDEIYLIEAGTIHAIGAGALIAEIQENSNLTYRLYDYDRLDKNGDRRELHIDKALEVARLQGSSEPTQPMRVLKYRRGIASELLCRCKYFEVHRIVINTETCRQMAEYQTDSLSFRVLLCIGGCGMVMMGNGEGISFFKGDCIFFPADSVRVRLHGMAQFLEVRG